MIDSTEKVVESTKEPSAEAKVYDIRERAFQFAVRIVKLCRYLENETKVSKLLINQLLDAGTSVGSNLEEAKAGQSSKDFVHKNSISPQGSA